MNTDNYHLYNFYIMTERAEKKGKTFTSPQIYLLISYLKHNLNKI